MEDFALHKTFFGGFVLTAFVNMLLTYYLMFESCKRDALNDMCHSLAYTMVKESLDYKKTILKVNVIAIPALMYFYWRHNAYCEPYVYSIFCFIEYAIVLTNVGYHFSGYYLLYGMEVRIRTYEKPTSVFFYILRKNNCFDRGGRGDDVDIV